MIAILWRYRVREEFRSDFERTYGATGEWAKLFSKADGYLGTELLHGPAGEYLTIDRWDSRADFDNFLRGHRAAYDQLDASCGGWTVEEVQIGIFDAPAR